MPPYFRGFLLAGGIFRLKREKRKRRPSRHGVAWQKQWHRGRRWRQRRDTGATLRVCGGTADRREGEAPRLEQIQLLSRQVCAGTALLPPFSSVLLLLK